MKFTEEKLEQAVIKLFEAEGYKHLTGEQIHKELPEVLPLISKGDVQLPDFQRGWVWDDYRIKALIANISNSYPVGAVMFRSNNV